jgi:hypothetical protein
VSHSPVSPATPYAGRVFITGSRGTMLRLPVTWRVTADSLPAVTPGMDLIGRNGQYPTGQRTLGVRTGSLTGTLHALPGLGLDSVYAILWPPDTTEWGWGPAATQVDVMNAVLQDNPLKLRLDSPTGRFLQISITNVTRVDVDFETISFDIAWEAKDPLWQDDTVTSSTLVQTPGVERIVRVNGTAQAEPIITITGQPGGTIAPRLVNLTNGTSLQYAGSLASGNQLVIDTYDLTAYRSAVSVLADMDDDFALGFHLDPGENTIKLETSSGNAGVTLAWRNKWH